MPLVLDLTSAEEERLRIAAWEKGLLPEELARQLIASLLVEETGPSVRVSDELRTSARDALREHAAGRTEDFPE